MKSLKSRTILTILKVLSKNTINSTHSDPFFPGNLIVCKNIFFCFPLVICSQIVGRRIFGFCIMADEVAYRKRVGINSDHLGSLLGNITPHHRYSNSPQQEPITFSPQRSTRETRAMSEQKNSNLMEDIHEETAPMEVTTDNDATVLTDIKTEEPQDAKIITADPVLPQGKRRPRDGAATGTAKKRRKKPETTPSTTSNLVSSATSASASALESVSETALPGFPCSGFVVFDAATFMTKYHIIPMLFTSPSTMVPFPTAPGVYQTAPTAPIPVGGVEESAPKVTKPKSTKAKGAKNPRPRGAPDFGKYMDRVRGLIKDLDAKGREGREELDGSIITSFGMPTKLQKLTNEERQFIQREGLTTPADLTELKRIADKSQYHGVYLKLVCAQEGIHLSRFVNESCEAPEKGKDGEKDGAARPPVYLDNSPQDLEKRAQGKVLYIGQVTGPALHRPDLCPYRMMSKDYQKPSVAPPSSPPKTPTPKRARPLDVAKDVEEPPLKRSPGRPKGSPNRVKTPPQVAKAVTTSASPPGKKASKNPPATVATPPVVAVSSVPPPQTITKNPTANTTPISSRSASVGGVALMKQVTAAMERKVNGFNPPPQTH